MENLEQFNFNNFETNEDKKEFYNKKILVFNCAPMGIYGESGRGFEFSYDENIKNYGIRVLTPSTRKDWQIALKFMSILAKKLSSNIISETGGTYTSETIKNFPYENDILAGIHSLVLEEDTKNSLIGIIREILFNKKMKDDILNSEDPISAFDNLFASIQYMDAYSAVQYFYRNKITILFLEFTLFHKVLELYFLINLM